MNISKLSLKALRDQINAGTREVTFQTDDGSLTQMVYIPRFTIPAGLWENGTFPATDLKLGGFFIDKYQASHKAATSKDRGIGSGASVPEGSTDHVAVSLPGRVPWTNVSFDNAKRACENRKINGVSCHLVTMQEWATMAFLIKLLGHDIRGNNNYGRDYRDSNAHENFGMPDPVQNGRVLTGTGPISWSHNGQANGVFDLVGNVWEWVDFVIEGGIYVHPRTAKTSEPIAQGSGSVNIDNVSFADNWDGIADTIIFDPDGVAEAHPVVAVTPLAGGAYDVSIAGTIQNEGGFPLGTNVRLEKRYCVIPGGSSAYLADDLNDSALTFAVKDRVDAPGSNGFQVGDIIQMDNEQVVVASVSGNTITVESRGANGSAPQTHPAGRIIAKLSPWMSNNGADGTGDHAAFQSGWIKSLRTEADLAPLAIPKEVVSSSHPEYRDHFYIRNYRRRAARRGGDWASGSSAQSGFYLHLNSLPSYADTHLGFRAALYL